MRILVYGLNYSPELTGIGKYTGEMAVWLAERGHEVRVVTAPPYYPAWRIREDYRGLRYRTERAHGHPVVYRTPLYVPQRPTGIKRIVHLVSFMLGSLPGHAARDVLAAGRCVHGGTHVLLRAARPVRGEERRCRMLAACAGF